MRSKMCFCLRWVLMYPQLYQNSLLNKKDLKFLLPCSHLPGLGFPAITSTLGFAWCWDSTQGLFRPGSHSTTELHTTPSSREETVKSKTWQRPKIKVITELNNRSDSPVFTPQSSKFPITRKGCCTRTPCILTSGYRGSLLITVCFISAERLKCSLCGVIFKNGQQKQKN